MARAKKTPPVRAGLEIGLDGGGEEPRGDNKKRKLKYAKTSIA